jgi:hypothetical protein
MGWRRCTYVVQQGAAPAGRIVGAPPFPNVPGEGGQQSAERGHDDKDISRLGMASANQSSSASRPGTWGHQGGVQKAAVPASALAVYVLAVQVIHHPGYHRLSCGRAHGGTRPPQGLQAFKPGVKAGRADTKQGNVVTNRWAMARLSTGIGSLQMETVCRWHAI